MFGKHFECLYDGSMVGAGCHVFAVMGYVIAKTRRGVVELNPKVLAFILGGTEKEMEEAIEFLCRPDVRSRTPDREGRRLVKVGPWSYEVVNWSLYRRIRTEAERREYNAVKQREYRERLKKGGGSGATFAERAEAGRAKGE